jgi:dTDP-4-dehydrorhamnose reductase
MKWLVVGASGLVGSELCRQSGATGAARHAEGAATVVLDLQNRRSIDAALRTVKPEAIAICSAWPWVDGCEKDPERSHRENVDTVANVIAETRGSGARLLFFSSDHVFDGRKPGPYVESDAVGPLSVYARHKREAEELLLNRGEALICRTAWVFGVEARRKNFVYQALTHARAGTIFKLPRSQAGCPTSAPWLCASALKLVSDGLDGVVHLTGGELLTKAQWARTIASALGLSLKVEEVEWGEAGQVAPRPQSVALASERHGLHQPKVTEILESLAKTIA